MRSFNPLTKIAIAGILFAALGCASSVKKVDYPESTNTSDEITSIRNELNQARDRQVDAFAPKETAEAEQYLDKAQKLQEKSAKHDEILTELGYAKAYLNNAEATAESSMKLLPEVATARQAALTAQAPNHEKSAFEKADRRLEDITGDLEKDKNTEVTQKERSALQSDYLNVELKAIKTARLGDAKGYLEAAKKEKAEKLAPKTYNDAMAKYKNAEAVIDTDRHNDTAVTTAVADANMAAQRALAVTNSAKNVKSNNPEETALHLVGNTQQISQLGEQLGQEKQENAATQNALNQTRKSETQLQAEKKFNDSFEMARKEFDPSEAEVYRAGNDLLIRFRTIQFSSGQAGLPAKSLSSLSKIKDIAKNMDAQKITVEGNTDSVGSKAINQKISQERADAVAKYIASEGILPADKIESVGNGFDKPLTSNKTKAGRAENRRVDVLITPTIEM